jgi:hypothetical protein
MDPDLLRLAGLVLECSHTTKVVRSSSKYVYSRFQWKVVRRYLVELRTKPFLYQLCCKWKTPQVVRVRAPTDSLSWLQPQRPGWRKKTPSFIPHPKHRYVVSSSYGAAVSLWMGGAGVLRFSRSTWEDLLLKSEYPGLSSHRGSSFYVANYNAMQCNVKLYLTTLNYISFKKKNNGKFWLIKATNCR